MNAEHISNQTQPHYRWGWLMALGVLWIIVGVVAIAAPGLATLTSVVFFGWLLILTGIAKFIHAFSVRVGEGFFLDLLLSILRTIVGVLLVTRPGAGAVSLTLVLALYFCTAGLYRLGLALTVLPIHRGWVALNGAISFVLGILIFLQWPSSSIWVIGTFIGIDLIVEGWTMIALGSAVHHHAGATGEHPGTGPAVGV